MDNTASLLQLIKQSGSVRRFTGKKVGARHIRRIIEAGVWGPSIFGVQPWHFMVITDASVIMRIASVVEKISLSKEGGLSKLLQFSSRIIRDCRVLVAVSIDDRLIANAAKYSGAQCGQKAYVAELLATGGAVQNMFLTVNACGLGSVWLDAPVIFPDKVKKILRIRDELVVFLAIGHPGQEIRRSKRDYQSIVKVI